MSLVLKQIEFLEDDHDGKIWHVEAIHVTTTANNRKYTEKELTLGARSLSFRPLNINHDESLMLPYPASETLEMDYNPKNKSVSGTIRISVEKINNMIASGQINKLSVEQLPTKGETCSSGVCEQHGVTFIGLALLTSGTTPGDGATKITETANKEMLLSEQLIPVNEQVTPNQMTTEEKELVYRIKIEGLEEAKKALNELQKVSEKITLTPTITSNSGSTTYTGTTNIAATTSGTVNTFTLVPTSTESVNLEAIRKKREDDTGACISHFVGHGKDKDQAAAICTNAPDPGKYAEFCTECMEKKECNCKSKEDMDTSSVAVSNVDGTKKKKPEGDPMAIPDTGKGDPAVKGGNVSDPVLSCVIKMKAGNPSMPTSAAQDFCSQANASFERKESMSTEEIVEAIATNAQKLYFKDRLAKALKAPK